VAGWLGRVMDDMKIDMDESSDRLLIYKPVGLPEQCEIVDTPGLFADKERTVEGEQVLYADLTQQYISEAHLVLYAVDATNPLQDSHSEVVRWLLRDLNKLEATVFVINKMDEVTDLTQVDLFSQQAAIKRDNLIDKLKRFASLTAEEASAVEANAHIVTLTRRVQDLEVRLEDQQPGARVLPLPPTKPKATPRTMDEPRRK
jgi:tRNA U34 5-carboxymethylaminomethyl modifying GTPase MnmE/TrmE